jgi:putative phage-type endonuclease
MNMLQKITTTSEEQWLQLRSMNINSTESAALFKMSPYLTAYELYHLKVGNIEDGFTETERTKAGKFLESSIAEFLAAEHDLKIQPMKDYYFDDVLKMGSSFDYEILEGKIGDVDVSGFILEIKNVDKFIYNDQWENDEAPEHIEVQVQHQMELADREGAVIAPLVGGNQLKTIIRHRDREMGLGIRSGISAFWDGVASGFEPTPDFTIDAEVVIKMHQAAGHETLEATDDAMITSLLEEYTHLAELARQADEARTEKKAEIFDKIGDNYLKVIAGNGFTLSCGMTKDSEPTVITAAMVGQSYGGRKGFRQCRVTQKKAK